MFVSMCILGLVLLFAFILQLGINLANLKAIIRDHKAIFLNMVAVLLTMLINQVLWIIIYKLSKWESHQTQTDE